MMSILKKRTVQQLIKWIVIFLAYGYLGYKLVTFESYDAFVDCLRSASFTHWLSLILCLLLMPLNFLSESLKWQYLLRGVSPISFSLACRSVLVGHVGAFPTPNRLGEYPARVTLLPLQVRGTAVAMGFVGSLIQTCIIMVCGMVGAFLFFNQANLTYVSFRSYLLIVLLFFLLLVGFIFSLPRVVRWIDKRLGGKEWITQLSSRLTMATGHELFMLTMISFMRYLIFSFQFYLMLTFCDVNLTALQALSGISLMYLFVTVTPSIGLSDVVVRSSYAIFIFSFFSVNVAGMAVASMLLWIVNSSVLMLMGSFYWNSHKVKF